MLLTVAIMYRLPNGGLVTMKFSGNLLNRITAPLTGRIGAHLVSVGNLIAGSRTATSPTTLLATIVSVDPIWLNLDMSEADYLVGYFYYKQQKWYPGAADRFKAVLKDDPAYTGRDAVYFYLGERRGREDTDQSPQDAFNKVLKDAGVSVAERSSEPEKK